MRGRQLSFVLLSGLLLIGMMSLSSGLVMPVDAQSATRTPTATLAPNQYVNPVLPRDFPDPDLIRVDGVYYAFATNSAMVNIVAAKSSDLVQWTPIYDVFPRLPKWAVQQFGYMWAPEVSTFDGGQTFVMYHVARFADGGGGKQCIGHATAESVGGPYTPVGDAPLICQLDRGGSIDPAVFVDDNGTPYILWKNDGNCCGQQTWLYIQQLAPDGLALVGEPTELVTADQAWEGILVEAPTLWKHEDKYYLFYSANDYASQRYATGYAVADNITGPYTKPTTRPLLRTDIRAGLVGPGGQDIVIGPDGETWILYHSWAPGSYRHMNLSRLEWKDGVPSVTFTPRGVPMERPQG